MAGTTIDIKTNGQGYTGYLAVPKSGKGPGIVLIQEIFGVNSHIREVADLYAEAGYVVLAPDVFWRAQPGVQLSYSPADMQKGMALMGSSDPKQMVSDLSDAATALRQLPQFAGKLGAVGYCMGGTFSYVLATRDLVDVAVCYYGGQIEKYLDDAKNLHCPIMMHFGAKDAHIPVSTVDKIRHAVEARGHAEVYLYDADHGFNCDQRGSYDRKSAMLAFGRSMVLLKNTLG